MRVSTDRHSAPDAWTERLAFLAPLFLAGCAIVCVRAVLGFQFPVPWPDETGFVAQAFDLSRTGSMFDPGLNPDRIVMWMPPGYMVLLAAVFRVFGYSFALARWISTLCCLASLALTAALVARLTRGWRRAAMAALTALVFIAPVMLVDSNIARMEMVFCCLVLLCLTAVVAERFYIAASLIGIAALVHFNAVYFAPPVLILLAWAALSGRVARPGGGDWLAMATAGLAVGAYALHMARNWPGFLADMQFQFQAKAFFGRDDPAHPAWLVWAGALAAVPALRGARGRAARALFGLAFLVMVNQGHELWYDYGLPLGFLLILLAHAAVPANPGGWRGVWAIGTAGLVVFASLRITPALRPLLPHWRMVHRSVVAPAEIARVKTFIATLHPGETVNFGWTGLEPFFFADLTKSGARWTILRHSVTQVFPLRAADWRVRCDSSEWPAFLFKFDIDAPRVGQDSGCAILPGRPAAAAGAR